LITSSVRVVLAMMKRNSLERTCASNPDSSVQGFGDVDRASFSLVVRLGNSRVWWFGVADF
jgi:hypothetical protein